MNNNLINSLVGYGNSDAKSNLIEALEICKLILNSDDPVKELKILEQQINIENWSQNRRSYFRALCKRYLLVLKTPSHFQDYVKDMDFSNEKSLELFQVYCVLNHQVFIKSWKDLERFFESFV